MLERDRRYVDTDVAPLMPRRDEGFFLEMGAAAFHRYTMACARCRAVARWRGARAPSAAPPAQICFRSARGKTGVRRCAVSRGTVMQMPVQCQLLCQRRLPGCRPRLQSFCRFILRRLFFGTHMRASETRGWSTRQEQDSSARSAQTDKKCRRSEGVTGAEIVAPAV